MIQHGNRRATIFGLALAAMLLQTAPVKALDIEASGFFGNLGLPWEGETPRTELQFPANQWLYGGRAALVSELGDGFSLTTEYETDTVLRHVVRGIVCYESGIASISAGPMVGAFNTAATPLKAGIDIGFKLEAPGIAFFSARAESSMGAGLATPGDYSQEYTRLGAGWYVYNAICEASMTTKRLTRILPGGTSLIDTMSDYRFAVNVYKKGAPYRVLTELAYRTMSRTYPGPTIDGLGAVILGARISADLFPSLTLNIGLDSGVYVFGIEAMTGRGPAPSSFLFQTNLGFVFHQ